MGEVAFCTVDELTEEDVADWRRLDQDQTGLANPFSSPDWVRLWYAYFAPRPQSQVLAVVRDRGRLIGVAPFFWSRVGTGRLTAARRLRLVGSGQGSALLELPQVLSAGGREREAVRCVVETMLADRELCSSRSWVEVSLGPGQPWFEPQWIHAAAGPSAFQRHQAAHACVVVPLASTWRETLAGLKRNVKESLRRSRNRLARLDQPASVVSRSADLDTAAVDRLLDLHRARSRHSGRELHHDAFADGTRRSFLRELLPILGRQDRARILELHIGDRQVAALLVLRAANTTYLHSSGLLPDAWDVGPVTYLQEHAFTQACSDGHRYVNLSPGPNIAKLRWSEQVEVYHDFAFGSGASTLLWRYAGVTAMAVRNEVTHSARMFTMRAALRRDRPAP